jgi:hypothetical protein
MADEADDFLQDSPVGELEWLTPLTKAADNSTKSTVS